MKTTHNRKAAKILSAFAQERSIRDLGQEKKVLEQRIDKANDFIKNTQKMLYNMDIYIALNDKGMVVNKANMSIYGHLINLKLIKF
jgi:predicted  nucleic acid-binding Zn-ribbon protein